MNYIARGVRKVTTGINTNNNFFLKEKLLENSSIKRDCLKKKTFFSGSTNFVNLSSENFGTLKFLQHTWNGGNPLATI